MVPVNSLTPTMSAAHQSVPESGTAARPAGPLDDLATAAPGPSSATRGTDHARDCVVTSSSARRAPSHGPVETSGLPSAGAHNPQEYAELLKVYEQTKRYLPANWSRGRIEAATGTTDMAKPDAMSPDKHRAWCLDHCTPVRLAGLPPYLPSLPRELTAVRAKAGHRQPTQTSVPIDNVEEGHSKRARGPDARSPGEDYVPVLSSGRTMPRSPSVSDATVSQYTGEPTHGPSNTHLSPVPATHTAPAAGRRHSPLSAASTHAQITSTIRQHVAAARTILAGAAGPTARDAASWQASGILVTRVDEASAREALGMLERQLATLQTQISHRDHEAPVASLSSAASAGWMPGREEVDCALIDCRAAMRDNQFPDACFVVYDTNAPTGRNALGILSMARPRVEESAPRVRYLIAVPGRSEIKAALYWESAAYRQSPSATNSARAESPYPTNGGRDRR